MADPQVNFFSSTLVGGYTDSDTELTLATGSGANLPDPSTDGAFNLVIYNESEIFVTTTFDGGSTDTRQDLASTNPEIVRVTARSGDVLTVTRAQEGTTASAKESDNTYRVILASTKKVFDDINDAIANVDLTTLTGVEELTFDTTGDEEFGLPAGTTAQRPSSPSAGYMRYNTDTKKLEIHTGGFWGLVSLENVIEMQTAELSVTANDAVALPLSFEVEYLVIAGGGGGGGWNAGGGGAGGYRTATDFAGEVSTSYTVTVGAGGAGGAGSGGAGSNGGNSVFSTITSAGGGGGGGHTSAGPGTGLDGGSGGGSADRNNRIPGSGNVPAVTPSQGNDGGQGTDNGDSRDGGGGGGGHNAVGGDATLLVSGGAGGAGTASSITGTSVTRAGGGGGGAGNSSTGGAGGAGGGGNGTTTATGQAGAVNTGGGGGGAGGTNGGYTGGAGGSGVVILRYPSNFSITIGAGLTGSETTDGSEKYAEITAGTGNVSWTTA